MSFDWVRDIAIMHDKYGVKKWMEENKENPDKLRTYLQFRVDFLREELDETEAALISTDAEEIVDGLIDMCVFAIGTLNVFGMDSQKAWDAVHNANMAKEPGVKESRPNPFGMPDLIKPEGWQGPSHEGNHGDLPNII